jgi:hypothetical protein
MPYSIDSLLDEILSGDHKSAQQNLSRLKSCAKFFNLPQVPNMIATTSAFVEPIEYVVNHLLKRSGLLVKIAAEVDVKRRQELEAEHLGNFICLVFFPQFFN